MAKASLGEDGDTIQAEAMLTASLLVLCCTYGGRVVVFNHKGLLMDGDVEGWGRGFGHTPGGACAGDGTRSRSHVRPRGLLSFLRPPPASSGDLGATLAPLTT